MKEPVFKFAHIFTTAANINYEFSVDQIVHKLKGYKINQPDILSGPAGLLKLMHK